MKRKRKAIKGARIEYLAAILNELVGMANDDGDTLLAYLIEMAALEAGERMATPAFVVARRNRDSRPDCGRQKRCSFDRLRRRVAAIEDELALTQSILNEALTPKKATGVSKPNSAPVS